MNFEKLAFNVVNKTMNIQQKPNLHFLKMNKKFPWMKGTFSLSFAAKKLKKSDKEAEKLLEKFESVDYGPLLIKKGNKYKVKEKIGCVVEVSYHPDAREFAFAVRDEIWKKNCFAIMAENDMERTRKFFELRSEDSLHELPKMFISMKKDADAFISIDSRNWSAWSKGIPDSKIKARRKVSLKLHEISDEMKTPWVLVGWPHKKVSKERKFPFEKLKKIMFDCIDYSYSKDIQKLVDSYTKKFKGAGIIRITADDGTDLSFSLKGRRLNTDTAFFNEAARKAGDVGGNIPTGEVFFAPVENSANGKIFIPVSVIPGEGISEGIWLFFKDGAVVKNTAIKGKGMLNSFIRKNGKDSNRIAEFGIGLNKKAQFTRGEIIIDEKIFGSIHVAIGWNKGYGGKTNAASHLDFIKDLRNCNGRVFIDGKLAIDKGKLVQHD